MVIERHRFMQTVGQCLTGVFSLYVGNDSGLLTSRHSSWHRCRRVAFSNKPGAAGPTQGFSHGRVQLALHEKFDLHQVYSVQIWCKKVQTKVK